MKLKLRKRIIFFTICFHKPAKPPNPPIPKVDEGLCSVGLQGVTDG
jgi:hypothetical protein